MARRAQRASLWGLQDTRMHATVFRGHEAIEDGEKDTREKDTCGQRFMILIDRCDGLMTLKRTTGRECDPPLTRED